MTFLAKDLLIKYLILSCVDYMGSSAVTSLLERDLWLLVELLRSRIYLRDFMISFQKYRWKIKFIDYFPPLSSSICGQPCERGDRELRIRSRGSHLESVTDSGEDFGPSPAFLPCASCLHLSKVRTLLGDFRDLKTLHVLCCQSHQFLLSCVILQLFL